MGLTTTAVLHSYERWCASSAPTGMSTRLGGESGVSSGQRSELVAVALAPCPRIHPQQQRARGLYIHAVSSEVASRASPVAATDARLVSCSRSAVAPSPVSRYGRRRSSA